MRPIEFRGYSLSDKEWKYGYYYVNTLGMHNIVCLDGMTWEVDPESVGQYIWHDDKNGKKIYEKSIIDNVYECNFIFPCYILKNIHNGDIITFQNYEWELKVTKEYR